MSQYYFFVASLPYLTYDNTQVMGPEVFLDNARQHLSARDLEILSSATIEAPVELTAEHATIMSWQRFDRGLRNALVKVRAKSPDHGEYVRTDSNGSDDTDRPGLTDAARESIGEESPLTGEHMLGRLRWEFLSDLETGHFFDLDVLIVYFLKLQLLARNRLFSRSDGETLFRAATEKIMNEYYQEQGDV